MNPLVEIIKNNLTTWQPPEIQQLDPPEIQQLDTL